MFFKIAVVCFLIGVKFNIFMILSFFSGDRVGAGASFFVSSMAFILGSAFYIFYLEKKEDDKL